MMNTNTEKDIMKVLLSLAKAAQDAQHKGSGEHSHKCNQCGHIWSHEDSCLNDVANHTCKCGVEQWWVFHDKREGQWQSCATTGRR